MREGKWELLVLVDGKPLPEHIISDGRQERHCVEAQPGAQFVVKVMYHGKGMHIIDVLLDGEAVSSRLAAACAKQDSTAGHHHLARTATGRLPGGSTRARAFNEANARAR